MRFASWKYEHTSLRYYRSRPQPPELLLIAGFHGDETQSIAPLTECVREYESRLPPFLYIPYACPSAVALGRRANAHGRDINRAYYLNSIDEEARTLMELLRAFSFRTVYAFHEDPDQKAFYLYDMALKPERISFDGLFRELEQRGVPVFTGIDDPDDLSLNTPIEYGYTGVTEQLGRPIQHGFFSEFTFHTGKSERHITFEVPGNVPPERKRLVVQQIFVSYILPGKDR